MSNDKDDDFMKKVMKPMEALGDKIVEFPLDKKDEAFAEYNKGFDDVLRAAGMTDDMIRVLKNTPGYHEEAAASFERTWKFKHDVERG